MKYNVGDRVRIKSLDWYNKNKDEDGNIDINHDFTFYADRSRYCGKVFTIVEVFDNCYAVKEDNNEYYWSDEMIEDLAEEGTKPKFKEGDRITNGIATLTILTLASDRYIVEDNFGGCGTLYFNTRDDWKIVEDKTKNWTDISIPDDPFTVTYGSPSMNDSMNKNNIDNGIIILPEGYIFKDENGNEILTSKIILEKKKKEYPKTFEECCKIMQVARPTIWFEYDDVSSISKEGDKYERHIENTLCAFRKLLICRDAYWKIAGEEMGLSKPWEPDWTYNGATKYCIGVSENEIQNFSSSVAQYILAFPTEEMRDTFKKNFDPDIEICKEFL